MRDSMKMNYVSADLFRTLGDDITNIVVSQARVVVPSEVVDSVFYERPVPESQMELMDCVDEMNDLDQWVAMEFGLEWCLLGIRGFARAEDLLAHVEKFGITEE